MDFTRSRWLEEFLVHTFFFCAPEKFLKPEDAMRNDTSSVRFIPVDIDLRNISSLLHYLFCAIPATDCAPMLQNVQNLLLLGIVFPSNGYSAFQLCPFGPKRKAQLKSPTDIRMLRRNKFQKYKTKICMGFIIFAAHQQLEKTEKAWNRSGNQYKTLSPSAFQARSSPVPTHTAWHKQEASKLDAKCTHSRFS